MNQLPDRERNFNIYREVTRMSSIPLYKAFIEVGASENSATSAAEDVIRVSQLEKLATKADLKSEIASLEARLIKWMVSLQLATLVMIATFIKFL